MTGSLEGTAALMDRVPGVLIEGMEGAGVAQAAALLGVPCTEIRGVSNDVGNASMRWRSAPKLPADAPITTRLRRLPAARRRASLECRVGAG